MNARVSPIISGKTSLGADLAPGNALTAGMRLREFEIIETLGEGGFSIVYAARDLQLKRDVAIKEYIPISLAGRVASTTVRLRSEHHRETFEAGLNGFINEARLLAQFKHPGLVEVLQFWEENGTAYMVMPRYSGKTLRSVLKDIGGKRDERWLRGIISPILDVLDLLHSRNVFHRDIAPDNILIKNDGTPVLLDLGSAREVVTGLQRALTVVVKPGYAPIEQYSSDFSLPQGPWTDVYAVGALLYFAITGSAPPASISRIMKDGLQPLAAAAPEGFSLPFLSAIDKSLSLQPADRPQSVADLRRLLGVTDNDKTIVSLTSADVAAAFQQMVSEPLPVAPPAATPVTHAEDDNRTVIVSAQEVAALVQQLATAAAPAEIAANMAPVLAADSVAAAAVIAAPVVAAPVAVAPSTVIAAPVISEPVVAAPVVAPPAVTAAAVVAAAPAAPVVVPPAPVIAAAVATAAAVPEATVAALESAFALDPLASRATTAAKPDGNSFPEMDDLLSGRLGSEAQQVAVPVIHTPARADLAADAPPRRNWVLPVGLFAGVGVVAAVAWYLLAGSDTTPVVVPDPMLAVTAPVATETPSSTTTPPADALAPVAGNDVVAPAVTAAVGDIAGSGETTPPLPATDSASALTASTPTGAPATPVETAPTTAPGSSSAATAAPDAAVANVLAPLVAPAETTSTSLEGPGAVIAPPVVATPAPAPTTAVAAAPGTVAGDSVASVDTSTQKPRDATASAKPKRVSTVKPVAATSGNVKFSIQPWGEIWINGSQRGVSPPIRFLQLEPGTYSLEVRNAGLEPLRRQITVKAGEPIAIEHRFQVVGESTE